MLTGSKALDVNEFFSRYVEQARIQKGNSKYNYAFLQESTVKSLKDRHFFV